MDTPPPTEFAFGRFQVLPDRREMLADGRPIQLGGRAFDVLMALIEARGRVLSKDALMEQVWPGRVIEENSLTAQIATLRRALGSDRGLIRTVSGRGYQFTGEIRVAHAGSDDGEGDSGIAAQPARSVLPPTNVPGAVSELIGREANLAEILRLVASHRLVTLTGAGGIGKTALALALARDLRPNFMDGVWIAEFSALAEPNLVPATVCAAVGVELGGGEVSVQLVARAIAGQRLLLVLDTCEHVIDVAARFAEALLLAGSEATIIATSREPLRAEGERLYPVPPLDVPPTDSDNEALKYGSLRLFTERARAAEPHFAPERHSRAIAEICRSLDGIPLAIELASARVAALGIEQVAARLSDRFHLLTGGRRTAIPRHQTLRAALDWSYELLSEPERLVLRRLAIFNGHFTLEAAAAVASGDALSSLDVVERVVDLVERSLVANVGDQGVARYRLLDTTRAYALEKLDETSEREQLSNHHAEYYRYLFERAEGEWETRPVVEWLNDYVWCLGNLRAALDWAFSPEGDASIGVALTTASVPLWMHLSLLDECHNRTEQALAILGAREVGDPPREAKLYASLASSSYGRAVFAGGQVAAIWTKSLECAENLGDPEYQLRSLWGLYASQVGSGDLHAAAEIARRFSVLATQQRRRNDELIGERMMGVVQHVLGDQTTARRHTEHMLANFNLFNQRSHELIRFQFDQRTLALAYLARILWLQGYPDEAIRTTERAVEEARETNHPLSLCYTLAAAACPVMLWVRDLAAAERYIAVLIDYSAKYALPTWGAMGQALQRVLLVQRREHGPGTRQMELGFDEWFALMCHCELAAGFARLSQIADGLAVVEQAIERAERTGARWLFAESLRIKGELLRLEAATGGATAAETHFRQALDWARRQGALSLELRAATSLARLFRDQGQPGDAMAVLQPVYDRFTEGFDTADLAAARMLLGELSKATARDG